MKHLRQSVAVLILSAVAAVARAEDGFTFLPDPFITPLPFDPGPSQGPPTGHRGAQNGPWQNDVVVYRSDAHGRSTRLHTFERAGVATLARLKDGRIMAAFQHFPKDDARNFDRVAVSFSSDEGAAWTTPKPISLQGMEEGLMRPFDPTLVPLPDGRVRMYFTSNRSPRFEESTPAIYSAISEDGVRYQFEPGVRFAIEGRVVIDCAACLHDGVYHLIVPDNGAPEDMRRERENRQQAASSGTGYHAVSKDGLKFERVEDVEIEGNLRWLGNLQSDGTKMTFMGTGRGIWMADSKDGVKWTPLGTLIVPGADPGAVRCPDGGWLIIATGPPKR